MYGFMYYYDPTYILVLIGLIISLWASFNVNATFSKYAKVRSNCGMTGADVAARILQANGIYDVSIEHVAGNLSDHYDPSRKVLRLSDATYNQTSVAAISVAAHECGHAIQHATGYFPLSFRSALVPIANIGSYASWFFIAIGLFFGGSSSELWIKIGILCFAAAVLFQLVTLPVEFNASSRALKAMEMGGIVEGTEHKYAKKVLFAAALTYVAAALTAILQLLRLIILFGGRDRD